jgi:hypothetical protein
VVFGLVPQLEKSPEWLGTLLATLVDPLVLFFGLAIGLVARSVIAAIAASIVVVIALHFVLYFFDPVGPMSGEVIRRLAFAQFLVIALAASLAGWLRKRRQPPKTPEELNDGSLDPRARH